MKSGVSAGRKRRSADSMTGRVCMWKVSDDIRMKIKEAADVISAAGSVYIFSHIVADGDALGSCAALCHALRMQGKEADILFEDDIPETEIPRPWVCHFRRRKYPDAGEKPLHRPGLQQPIPVSEERKSVLSCGKKDGLHRSSHFQRRDGRYQLYRLVGFRYGGDRL